MTDTRQSNIPDNGSERGNTNLPAPPKPLKPPQGHGIGAPAFFTATLPWRQASWPRRALWLFYEWLAIMAAGLIIQGLWLAAWWRRRPNQSPLSRITPELTRIRLAQPADARPQGRAKH
jgi:hypothetical protein